MHRSLRLPRLPLAPAAALLAAGCALAPSRPNALPPVQLDTSMSSVHSVTVLSRHSLGVGRSLAEALSGRVLGLRFSQSASDPCPRATLRGAHSPVAQGGAEVYVNGFRMGNSCVLQDLDPQTVQRVEIYPGGRTGRTGYAPHSGGLILVFTEGSAAP